VRGRFVAATRNDVSPQSSLARPPGGSEKLFSMKDFAGDLGKALTDLGIDPRKTKVLGQGEITDENALKVIGNSALGMITAFHYDYNHKSKANAEFVAAYRAANGRNPDIYSIGGWDGMHLIYESLKKAGGKADGDSLIAAAKGMKWESPRGPIEIDAETRDIIQTVYIRRVEKVGDQLVNVEIDKVDRVKDPVKERMKK